MRRTVPCQICKAPACELELPVLDGVAAQLFRPMLRFIAAKQGFELDSASDNPLEGLEPAAIGELLAVRCVDCVELRERPSLQVRA